MLHCCRKTAINNMCFCVRFYLILDIDDRADLLADDVLERLKKRISRDMKHGVNITQTFDSMDKDGDGELDIDELESAMDKLGRYHGLMLPSHISVFILHTILYLC